MPDEPTMLDPKGVAAYMGVGLQAVKKWRGNTRTALRAHGQLTSEKPTVPLPRNALPIPDNHVEHVRDGVAPRWWPSTIDKWAERTERRDPKTGKFCHASPTGRPPARRQPLAA